MTIAIIQGKHIFHYCRERLEERLAEALASLPQEEKSTLVRSLEALKISFGDASAKEAQERQISPSIF